MGKRKRHLRHIWDGAIVCILTSPTSAGWCGKEWQVDMEEFFLLPDSLCLHFEIQDAYIMEKEEGITWWAQCNFHGLRAVRKNRHEYILQ